MSKPRFSKVELALLRSLVVKDRNWPHPEKVRHGLRLCRTELEAGGHVPTHARAQIALTHTHRGPTRGPRGLLNAHTHPCTSEPLPLLALHPRVTSSLWLMITLMFMQPWGGLTEAQGRHSGLGAPGQLQPILGFSPSQGPLLQSGTAQPLAT